MSEVKETTLFKEKKNQKQLRHWEIQLFFPNSPSLFGFFLTMLYLSLEFFLWIVTYSIQSCFCLKSRKLSWKDHSSLMELMILCSLILRTLYSVEWGVSLSNYLLNSEKNHWACIYRISNHNFILYSISNVPEWMAYTQSGGTTRIALGFLQNWNSFKLVRVYNKETRESTKDG